MGSFLLVAVLLQVMLKLLWKKLLGQQCGLLASVTIEDSKAGISSDVVMD